MLSRTAKILLLPEKDAAPPKNNLTLVKSKLQEEISSSSSVGSFQHLALTVKNASFSWKKPSKIDIIKKKRTMRDYETARSTSRLFSARSQG